MKARGFTLVELLVTIALMGLMGVICWRGLDYVVAQRGEVERESLEVARVLRTFAQVERDLAERLPDTALASAVALTPNGMEVVRHAPQAGLVRVVYRVEPQGLMRNDVLLLPGASAIRLRVHAGGFWAVPGEPRVQTELWRVAAACLPEGKRTIGAYTQGLMDLGATTCTLTKPDCNACPVAVDCVALRDGRVDELPYPRPRRALPRREVTVLLLTRDGDVLLEQRPAVGVWSGLWSLPEVARDADVALHVAARFNAATDALRPLPPLTHVFTHFALTMHPVRVPVTHWPTTAGSRGVEWFARDSAIAAAVPAPIRKLLRTLDLESSVL